jgi:hypothetical protein
MRRLTLFVAILLISGHVKAQTAEDSIKSVVTALFTAMKTADAALLKSVFTDSAILQTVSKDKAGKIIAKTESLADFIQSITTLPKGDADERITFELVKRDGDLAIVWTPYQFYYKSQFSHCGVNSFQLIRVDGNWKIQYIIDTRRRKGCQ